MDIFTIIFGVSVILVGVIGLVYSTIKIMKKWEEDKVRKEEEMLKNLQNQWNAEPV